MEQTIYIILTLLFSTLSSTGSYINRYIYQCAYKKIIHNSDPKAKCLEGSSPALYLHEGGDITKFLIFFVGGEFYRGCTINEGLEECYQRSKRDVGSSRNLPQTVPHSVAICPQIQPKFVIFYCDGAQHQGYNKNPISYKDTILQFRGEAYTNSHLKWISTQYDFTSAEKVLLTGASSGAIATHSYSNYVRSLLKKSEALYRITDSGAIMNANNPYTGAYIFSGVAKAIFLISKSDAKSPNQLCNSKYPGEDYKCLSLEYVFTNIQGRFMIINSEYDQQFLENIGITCLKDIDQIMGMTLANCNATELSYIEAYRRQFMEFISIFMQFQKNSAWTISCCEHSYACLGWRCNALQLRVPAAQVSLPKKPLKGSYSMGRGSRLSIRKLGLETCNAHIDSCEQAIIGFEGKFIWHEQSKSSIQL